MPHAPPRTRPRGWLLAALVLPLLASCTRAPPVIDQIRARGVLRVVTLNSPTTYYLGAHGPQGLEYRLTDAFARQLGVRLQVQTLADATAMRHALEDGSADLAAARISADISWREAGLASHAYQQLPQLLIQRRGNRAPRDITRLRGGRLVVREDSPQQLLLQEIRRNGVPSLAWSTVPMDMPGPLARINAGTADYTIVDADEFAFDRHIYPDTEIAFTLPDPRPVQWIMPRNANQLRSSVNRFFAAARKTGLLARIEQQAAAETGGFNYLQALRFRADVATRLPMLRDLFEQAAAATGLDWRLIAAVGYQESKWDQQAKSNNDALGVMMLTPDAATAVGITDRTDLRQNILGGALYLKQVIDTIPTRIAEPDRSWLGLAAYNVGYGHLEDARVIAQMRGKNPDSWDDVHEQLPLLADEEWYTRVKRGYARGWEPANFVEQVRQYLAVLEWIGAESSTTRTASVPATAAAAPVAEKLVQQRTALTR